jgi:hypothetical protein
MSHRYAVTVTFTTDRPLTPIELDTLEYSAQLIATDPTHDDGEHAAWSGRLESVEVTRARYLEPGTFDLDELARRVTSLGVPSSVEHSGGGVATLYAGYSGYPEVIAGPGYFTHPGPGYRDAVGSWREFSYGIDDPEQEAEHVLIAEPRDLEELAHEIADLARSLELEADA